MFYQIFCWFILKIHSNSIKNSNHKAELSIFFKKIDYYLPVIAIVTRDDTLEACSDATQKVTSPAVQFINNLWAKWCIFTQIYEY